MDNFSQSHAEGFRQILHCEATQDFIWDMKMPGEIPFWIPIRYMIARAIEDSITGSINFKSYQNKFSLPSLPYLWKTLKHNIFNWKQQQHDILFITTDTAVLKIKGRGFNRLADYFGLCYPQDTAIMEMSVNFQDHGGRALPYIMNYELSRIKNIFALRKILFKDQEISYQISGFINKLKQHIAYINAEDWQEIENFLYKTYVGQKYYCDLIHKMLDKIQPKIIILEDGCYGYQANIIKIAKERAIKTIEFQHGMVSKNHEAYNYHPNIFSKIKPYLPDYFLAYGKWWLDYISLPCEKIIIGNPHFSESNRFRPKIKNAPPSKQLLLISSGMQPKLYIKIISEFCALNKEYSVIFRKHPLENYDYDELKPLYPQVIFDKEPNINASISIVDGVIGDISTGLFEAKASNKQVFVLESPLTARHIPPHFNLASNGAEINRLLNEIAIEPDYSQSLFAPDWQKNYRNFIGNILYSQ